MPALVTRARRCFPQKHTLESLINCFPPFREPLRADLRSSGTSRGNESKRFPTVTSYFVAICPHVHGGSAGDKSCHRQHFLSQHFSHCQHFLSNNFAIGAVGNFCGRGPNCRYDKDYHVSYLYLPSAESYGLQKAVISCSSADTDKATMQMVIFLHNCRLT